MKKKRGRSWTNMKGNDFAGVFWDISIYSIAYSMKLKYY